MSKLCPTVAWATSVDVASSTDRLVLVMLAALLDGEPAGPVGQAELAARAGVTDRTVRRSMRTLVDAGLVEVYRAGPRASDVRLLLDQQDRTHGPLNTGHTVRSRPDTMSEHGSMTGHTIQSTPDTASDLRGVEPTPTVLQERSPPVVPPGADRDDHDDDHDASRPEPQHRPPGDIDDTCSPERWQALEKAISGRTLDKRGRFMGEGLTAVERDLVRRFVAQHGLAVVEEIVAGMPARVQQPTGMIAARLKRVAEHHPPTPPGALTIEEIYDQEAAEMRREREAKLAAFRQAYQTHRPDQAEGQDRDRSAS